MERTLVCLSVGLLAMALLGCEKQRDAGNSNAIFDVVLSEGTRAKFPQSNEHPQEDSQRHPALIEISSQAVATQWKEAVQGKWEATGATYHLTPGHGIRYYTFHGDYVTIDWEANFEQNSETREFRIDVTKFPPRLITSGRHPLYAIPSLYPANDESESLCVEVIQFDRDLLWIDLCSNGSIASGHNFPSGTCFREVRD